MVRLRLPALVKRPRVFIPVAAIILLTAAILMAVHSLNAPAVGSVNQSPPGKSVVQDPYANPGQYSGKYISFTYPAHYKKLPSQITGSYLEVAGFYATDHSSKQISVGVLKESLNDDSGVALRRSKPLIYQESPRTQSGIVIFSSTTGGSERTAYVPHQDLVATFSITAPPGWDLTADMETILTSLHWR